MRRDFIGGSDIAAVMGLSQWDTPLSVWCKKTGVIDGFKSTEAMELGTELEEFIAQKFSKKSGKKVRRDNRDFRHKKYDYMRSHIDRWIVGGGILECKTCSAFKHNEWAGDDIPDEYLLQVNWYLGILEQVEAHIAVLIGGQKYLDKKLMFDPALFDKQVESAKYFWEEFVLKNQPPMAISGDNETLKAMYPESMGEIQVVTGDREELVNQIANDYMEGKKQEREIKRENDLNGNLLRQMIQNQVGVETGQTIVTWRSQQKTKLDLERMRDDDIYDHYAIRSSNRVLRVNGKTYE